MVLRSYRTKRVVVLMPILVVSLALLLSLLYYIEQITAPNENLVFLTTLCFALGMIIRPLVLYFFMRMTMKNKYAFIASWVLIIANIIVYLFSLFLFAPALSHLVLWYEHGEPVRGPLFFFCHIIVAVMMSYFVGYSIYSLKGRHRYDAIACLICAAFIAAAVVLETFSVAEYLLNTTIAIACLFYVVHLYQQAAIKDALTGLYDRKAYYYDLTKLDSKVTGIIIIDMNSLKKLNDTEGHQAGDLAIKTIADVINDSLDSSHMYAYRMGGDEFLILSTSTRFSATDNTINNIKEKIAKTPYSIAIGYAKREENEDTNQLSKRADEMMYQDKSNYYQTSGVDRRRR